MALLLSLLFLLANVNEAAVPCNAVEAKAAGCIGFAMGRDSNPSPACCGGLQRLAKTVKTVDYKKTICRCLNAAVKAFPGVNCEGLLIEQNSWCLPYQCWLSSLTDHEL